MRSDSVDLAGRGCVRLLPVKPAAPTTDQAEPSRHDEDRACVLLAIAEGLADDAAGRVMDTKTLKESLERELGPIVWL